MHDVTNPAKLMNNPIVFCPIRVYKELIEVSSINTKLVRKIFYCSSREKKEIFFSYVKKIKLKLYNFKTYFFITHIKV